MAGVFGGRGGRILLGLGGVVAAALAVSWLAAPRLDWPTMDQEIQRLGSRAIVDRLIARHRFLEVVQAAAHGDPAAIAMAPKLVSGADALHQRELTVALALALPKTPRAVLSAIEAGAPYFPPEAVCAMPFTAREGPDRKAYRAEATRGLNALADPDLADVRSACANVLAVAP
jgi:hypothetical protein